MDFDLYVNNNILLITLILFLIVLGIILIKLRFFTFNRVIYLCLIICNLSVIFGRFACESLKCFFNLPNYFFQKYYAFGNLVPDNCEKCKPDWSLRNGVDEGGLILLGLVFVLIVLWIKNENLATIISKISKISFLGTVELENLNKEIEKYQNKNNLTLNSTIENSLKEEDEVTIEKANTPDERLDLICNLIEGRIRELYIIKNNNKLETPIRNEAIIEKLEKDNIINNELKNILITFFKYKTDNYLKRNGRFTFGLIELGRKITRLLRDLLKKVFTKNKTFYGEVEEVKFDRTKFENISEDNIVITTTVSLADSNDNYFPLQSLSIQNFKLVESFGDISKEVNIEKVEEIANSSSRLRIDIL